MIGDPIASLRLELCTPVNHIIGYTELLLERSDAPDMEEFVPDLEKVHGAGRRLLQLIGDMLDLKGLQTGEVDMGWVRHELRTPLNQIIGYSELLQEEAEDAGMESMVPDLAKIDGAARSLFDLINQRFASGQTATTLAGPAPAAPAPSPAQPALPTITGKLLVVDDNEMNRDMLARRLEHEGHEVSRADDGRQALDQVRRQPFDLVLLDIMMPVMDGYQALAALKEDPELRDIPVIMLSALDDMQSIVRCIEMGAEDYLPKPFDPILLRARIGASLEKKAFRDQEVEYMRQVARVIGATSAVEAGTFQPESLEDVAGREDALGQLARVFQRMGREVQAREQRLRQQVRELKVEIDQAKRAKEVAEITGTDFFQDLQQKADAMRRRNRT